MRPEGSRGKGQRDTVQRPVRRITNQSGARTYFHGMRSHLWWHLAVVLALAPTVAAQTQPPAGLEAPTARVAVFTASLYNDQANVREASDSGMADTATAALRSRLGERLAGQLVPFAAVDSAAAGPDARRLAGGVACHVRVACAVGVARALGARWAVLTKVSKTSNLIWLMSAQLIRAADGRIVLDDSTELKGNPGEMTRIGTRIFADRVARTVRNGGLVDIFPARLAESLVRQLKIHAPEGVPRR